MSNQNSNLIQQQKSEYTRLVDDRFNIKQKLDSLTDSDIKLEKKNIIGIYNNTGASFASYCSTAPSMYSATGVDDNDCREDGIRTRESIQTKKQELLQQLRDNTNELNKIINKEQEILQQASKVTSQALISAKASRQQAQATRQQAVKKEQQAQAARQQAMSNR